MRDDHENNSHAHRAIHTPILPLVSVIHAVMHDKYTSLADMTHCTNSKKYNNHILCHN